MSLSQDMCEQDNNGQISTARVGSAVPLWCNRDFWLLEGGQLVSSVGTSVSLVAFPLLILALTHSPLQAGLITGVRGLPYVLLSLPAGALVDRWNRKRLMILCDMGRAIALGSIPVTLFLGHLSYLQFYIVSLVEGTLFVFFNSAEAASLPRVVAKEQITNATGVDQTLYSGALLLGPSLGGLLYGLARMWPFIADAISYVVSVISLFFISREFQEERDRHVITVASLWLDVKEGLAWLWHNPLIRFLAILTCGLTTPCYGYILILEVIAQHQHASAFAIGLIIGAGGIGSVVGAMLASPLEKRFGFRRVIVVSAWIWAISWLSYALAPTPLWLGIVNAVSFMVVPVYTVMQYSYRLSTIPDALQGRVNSVFRLISFGGQPLGIWVTGGLLQFAGPFWSVVLLCIPQLILAFAATFNQSLRAER